MLVALQHIEDDEKLIINCLRIEPLQGFWINCAEYYLLSTNMAFFLFINSCVKWFFPPFFNFLFLFLFSSFFYVFSLLYFLFFSFLIFLLLFLCIFYLFRCSLLSLFLCSFVSLLFLSFLYFFKQFLVLQ